MSPRRPRFPLGLAHVSPASEVPGVPASALATLRPQRPLREAMRDAARHAMPSGVGLDSRSVRERMVARLRAEGLDCEPVLAALALVPRHAFLDAALVPQAYEDTSLPIGLGQTISKPSVVGRMLALLFDGRNARARGALGRTLEIGTGCGYQAALLACLSTRVLSIERLRPLHERARERLAPMRRDNLRLVYGDGRLGHLPNAPYDSIIAAAGGEDLPTAWLDQLEVGGRLVAPVESARGQSLVVVDRSEQGLQRCVHEGVRFVPLKSGIE